MENEKEIIEVKHKGGDAEVKIKIPHAETQAEIDILQGHVLRKEKNIEELQEDITNIQAEIAKKQELLP